MIFNWKGVEEVVYLSFLPTFMFALSLIGIIVFIDWIDSILVTFNTFYGTKTPSVNTDGILLDTHNNWL